MAEVAELFLHHLHRHRHHAAAEADAAEARRAEQPPIWQDPCDDDDDEDDDDYWPYSREIYLAGSALDRDEGSRSDRDRADEGDGYAVGYGDDEFETDEPLQWDCLRIEDEWEEVVDRSGEEERQRSVEWEVLLTMNNIERNSDLQEDYVYTSEYDVLFGQFTEHDGAFVRGSIPTATSVVESLPSVILGQEDVKNSNALCAVCKDDVAVGESVKQLPCLHHYHRDCILPWLRMRNTCPVCRYELPSDDQDYQDSTAFSNNA